MTKKLIGKNYKNDREIYRQVEQEIDDILVTEVRLKPEAILDVIKSGCTSRLDQAATYFSRTTIFVTACALTLGLIGIILSGRIAFVDLDLFAQIVITALYAIILIYAVVNITLAIRALRNDIAYNQAIKICDVKEKKLSESKSSANNKCKEYKRRKR